MLKKITISGGTIRKKLKSYTPKRALIEYIENGIDAGAKNIDINFKIDKTIGEVIERISIYDDGKGINFSELYKTFNIYGDSGKVRKKHKSDTSGKDGQGRLTFFVFSGDVEWNTTYKDANGNKNYSIKMTSHILEDIDIPEKKEELKDTTEETGTLVIFKNIIPTVDETYLNNDFIDELYQRLAWRIILKGIKIKVNGYELDLSRIIEKEFIEQIICEEQSFEVKLVKWKYAMVEEESRYYFINKNNEEVCKIPTSYNRGGDEFYHSVYVKSAYFDNFSYSDTELNNQSGLFDDGKINQHDKIFVALKKELHILVGKKRKPFIEKYADQYVQEKFENEQIIIKGETPLDIFRYGLIRDTFKEIYLIEPKFLTLLDNKQLSIFAKLIDTVLAEGRSTKIFDIIDSTLKLDQEERENFAGMLKNIELSNIIKTIDIIKDRFEVIEVLDQFVFNTSLKANEVKHLQTLISDHYWIFGEEYYLIGEAEVKFEENLRRFLYILDGEKRALSEVKMDDDDKHKEMDIFMCKVDRTSDLDNTKVKNIIVELKHPSKTLGQKELTQITTYMTTILKEDRFNGKGYEWRFYLVGNRYDEIIKGFLNGLRIYGDGVIFYDPEKNYKVFCKTWSDIIEENKTKLNFIRKQMDLKQEVILKDANEGLERISNSAVLEGQIVL